MWSKNFLFFSGLFSFSGYTKHVQIRWEVDERGRRHIARNQTRKTYQKYFDNVNINSRYKDGRTLQYAENKFINLIFIGKFKYFQINKINRQKIKSINVKIFPIFSNALKYFKNVTVFHTRLLRFYRLQRTSKMCL